MGCPQAAVHTILDPSKLWVPNRQARIRRGFIARWSWVVQNQSLVMMPDGSLLELGISPYPRFQIAN